MPKGSKVLMADDDKMLIDMYKERLELAGYNITTCANGEEALAKIREIKPDIVLLDIMMPKVNGYETLASLKSDPQTKDIPVVMLSALMRDFNREKAVEAGADDYLIKSEAMPADVITKIEQILTKYGKGTVSAPGMAPPNITPSIAPPPVVPPVITLIPKPIAPTPMATNPIPTPPPEVMHPIAPPSEKIVFEPAPPTPPPPLPVVKEEAVPVVKFEPVPPQKLPTMPWEADAPEAEKPPKPQKNPASTALIVIMTILLTALANDLVIYYFFFMKK